METSWKRHGTAPTTNLGATRKFYGVILDCHIFKFMAIFKPCTYYFWHQKKERKFREKVTNRERVLEAQKKLFNVKKREAGLINPLSQKNA